MQAWRAWEVAGQVNLQLAVGAGQARVGRAEQRDGRHVQRGGQVAETGIHRDAGLRTSEDFADAGQIELRQHFGVFETGGDAFGAGLFLWVAPRQFDADAEVADAFSQFAPVTFRPVFGVPSSAMQEDHKGVFARQLDQTLDVEAVIAQAFRQVVAESDGEQLAHSLDGVLTAGHSQFAVIETRSHRLSRRTFIEAGYRRFDVAGQPGAFQQALSVDHQVVFIGAHTLFEAFPLAAGDGFPEVFAPATDRHRNHFANGRVPGRDLGETFFHYPVELDSGNGPGGVGQRRQRMNHVTQR
ncbi:hypothetical protein D3C76_478010 [compost metagenome]